MPAVFASETLGCAAASRRIRCSSFISETPLGNIDCISGLHDIRQADLNGLRLAVYDSLDLDSVRGGAFGKPAGQADRLQDGRAFGHGIRRGHLDLARDEDAVAIDARDEDLVAVLEGHV